MKNKITDFNKYKDYIKNYDLANLFYVYDEKSINNTTMTYNINRTIQFSGIKKADKTEFDYYEVIDGDSWNLISFKKYGTTSLWWLICKINGVSDPTNDPEAGDVLRVFSKDRVNTILQSIRNA